MTLARLVRVSARVLRRTSSGARRNGVESARREP